MEKINYSKHLYKWLLKNSRNEIVACLYQEKESGELYCDSWIKSKIPKTIFD